MSSDELTGLRNAVAAVRHLHRAGRQGPLRNLECTYCCLSWPCETITALDDHLAGVSVLKQGGQ